MIKEVPPKQHPTIEHTAYWEAFFSPEEIQKLLALPEWDSKTSAVVGADSGHNIINTSLRRSDIVWLNSSPETEWIWEKIVVAVSEVNRHFFHLDLTGCYEPMQLSEYKGDNTGCYGWHIDTDVDSRIPPRKLSMSLLLSDPSDYEGGDLQVKTINDEPKTLEAKQGRAWFFPSYTLHQVTPVTSGTRRSIVLWVGGPAFK